ncbi:hypothetical protein CapIbe_008974 [Capra ibex]
MLERKRLEIQSPKGCSIVSVCDPVECRLPGSSVRGISQARILEWVAMSSSRGTDEDGTHVSYFMYL